MTHWADVPLWLAILVAAFVVLGSTLSFLGAMGLLQLRSFYDRLHAPTLVTSWGTAATMLASMILFGWHQGRPVLHELVIGAFVMAVTPITLMLLGRAALHRDRIEGSTEVPPADVSPTEAQKPQQTP